VSEGSIDASGLRASVLPCTDFRAIEVVSVTESTNADLLARADEPPWLVLVAQAQTQGRGRLGREWLSDPGAGLACSVLLAPAPAPARWGWLPLLTGVAAVEAVRTLGVAEATLKWPNDVLIGGRKVAGILAERTEPGRVVVGIGVNVAAAPAAVATATSLAEAGSTASTTQVAEAILLAWDRWLSRWVEAAGDAEVSGLAGAYRAHCSTLRRDVSVMVPGGKAPLSGQAIDIDADGRLVLGGIAPVDADAGSASKLAVAAGDVEHVR
jgi:BirA family biotin operon repressor/biotin-[acetyl-CoA-carboxylase] ligase